MLAAPLSVTPLPFYDSSSCPPPEPLATELVKQISLASDLICWCQHHYRISLTTHTPLIKEVHFCPLVKGVGPPKHCKINLFRHPTPVIKGVNLHGLNWYVLSRLLPEIIIKSRP